VNRIFPGWLVVASVFLILMANAGLGFYGIAIYLDAITAEQDLSTTTVSLATSVYFVVSGITGRLLAPVIERRDIRIVVAIGGVISGIALWLMGQISGATSLFAIYIVLAVGVGLSGLVPATTLVTRWFQTKRSVALSVASTGLSFGGLTFARMASALIDRDDLAAAAPWLGVMYAASIAVALFAMWPNPASRGLLPDGAQRTSSTSKARVMNELSIDYDDAVRTRFFRVICIGFLLAMGAQVGAISQLAKLGTERVDRPTGAIAISTIAGVSIIARLIGGVVASRVPIMAMTTVLAVIQSGGLVLLALADTRGAIVFGSVVFGFTIGNLLMLQPLIVAEAFGLKAYPRLFSLQQLVVTAGVAFGPFLLGALHDLSSYRLSFLVAAGLSISGAGVLSQSALWRPTPERIQRQQVLAA